MPVDSDPIIVSRKTPDDFTSVALDIASHIQFKFLGLMLLMFIIISSDVFVNRVLSKFKGAVDGKCPANWGVFLQGLFLVMVMTLIDGLVRQKII